MAGTDEEAAWEAAMRLLVRREHAARELHLKLLQRGFEDDVIDPVLRRLEEEGSLSNQRFAEEFTRKRVQQGYGPVRIRAELRERGVDDGLIAASLGEFEDDWPETLRRTKDKRFGAGAPKDIRDRARQQRFLVNRGFSPEQIRRLYRDG